MKQCITTSKWNRYYDRDRINEAHNDMQRKRPKGHSGIQDTLESRSASKNSTYSRLFSVHRNVNHAAGSMKIWALAYGSRPPHPPPCSQPPPFAPANTASACSTDLQHSTHCPQARASAHGNRTKENRKMRQSTHHRGRATACFGLCFWGQHRAIHFISHGLNLHTLVNMVPISL